MTNASEEPVVEWNDQLDVESLLNSTTVDPESHSEFNGDQINLDSIDDFTLQSLIGSPNSFFKLPGISEYTSWDSQQTNGVSVDLQQNKKARHMN